MRHVQFAAFASHPFSQNDAIGVRMGRAFLAIGLLLIALPVLAQSSQITGVVTDPQQALVAGAQITVTNSQTLVKTTTVTNNEGVYLVSSLPPGTYKVEVQAKGFQVSELNGVEVRAEETVHRDIAGA